MSASVKRTRRLREPHHQVDGAGARSGSSLGPSFRFPPAALRAAALLAALLAAALMLEGALDVNPAAAQILNTLRGFDDREPGWSGGGSALVSGSGGNTEFVSYSASARIQWQSTTDRVRLIGSASRKKSGGRRISEAETGHLRQNHRLLPRLWTLAFVQVQRDPFQRLKSRTLVGAGARVDLVHRDTGALSLGSSPMWDQERIEDETGERVSWRLSSFVAATWEPKDGTSVDATAFYQPRFSDFADTRATADLTLNLSVFGPLSLVAQGKVQYNSRPPSGVKETDWSYQSGLSLEL